MIVPSIIVIIIVLIVFLFGNYGLFNNENQNDKKMIGNMEIKPGMLGSPPSDSIDVYDSKKVIVIPDPNAVNALIDSFSSNAKKVLSDFKRNQNSEDYKKYLFDDYKIDFIKRQGSLSETQEQSYYLTKNTTGQDIDKIITYFIDKIKYNNSKSYYSIKREILSADGKSLQFNETDLDNVISYVLNGSKLPGDVIILLKYKLNEIAQDYLDQIVMLAGYNYYTVLNILIRVLAQEPNHGINLLGISNNVTITASSAVPGFWTQVYYIFLANNINHLLVHLIKNSYMTEEIYSDILSSIVSYLQNPKITESINNMIQECKKSVYYLIKSFPYYFTYQLFIDAIKENKEMIIKHGKINVNQIDGENMGIQNIDKYNVLINYFPMSMIPLVLKEPSNSAIFDMKSPNYYILSDQYIINNFISFPNVLLKGIGYNLLESEVVNEDSGYVLINNVNTISSMEILNIILFGGFIDIISNSVKYDISEVLLDMSILFGPTYFNFYIGTYNMSVNSFTMINEVTSNWTNGELIEIPAGYSLQIKPKKSTSLTLFNKYLKIIGMLISIVKKPINPSFLQIMIIHDKKINTPAKYNLFDINNIPLDGNNILFMFDSNYYLTDTLVSYTMLTNALSSSSKLTIVDLGSTITANGIIIPTVVKKDIVASNPSSINYSWNANYGLVADTLYQGIDNKITSKHMWVIQFNNPNAGTFTINSVVVFGNIDYLLNFTNITDNKLFSDKYVLDKNNIMVYKAQGGTLSDNIVFDDSAGNPIIDLTNRTTWPITIGNNQSLYFIPTVSSSILSTLSVNNRYLHIRAMLINISNVQNTNALFEIQLYNLWNNTKYVYSVANNAISVQSNDNILILFNKYDTPGNTLVENPTGLNSSSTIVNPTGLNVLPTNVNPTGNSSFNILPTQQYEKSMFGNQVIEYYHNPLSEEETLIYQY